MAKVSYPRAARIAKAGNEKAPDESEAGTGATGARGVQAD